MTTTQNNPDDFEKEMQMTLANLAPETSFEDRLAATFRQSRSRFALRMPRVNPFVLRSAIGVAATLAVAAIGYLGMQALEPRGTAAGLLALGQPVQPAERPALAGKELAPRQGGRETVGVWFESGADTKQLGDLVLGQKVSSLRDEDASTVEPNYRYATPAERTSSQSQLPALKAGVALEAKQSYFDTAQLGYAVQTEPSLSPVARVPESPAQEPAAAEDRGREKTVLGAEVRAANPPMSTPVVEAISDARKIIRTGNIEFEVQSFDAGFATLSTIVSEERGMIGSTESTKLENGKTRGTVVVRVPPENLDRLVTKLRGLGELKTQNISAQDVSRQYSDLESQLRAANAMQDRLIQIIKEGKGAIKDLLAAEKELGNWRTKIEQLEGERRFIDSQVSLSTLSITLTEKDISQAATLTRTENVNAGIECDDVEKARAQLLASIDELGGRVMSADLKQLDAGQFNANIVAEVKADSSGQLIDRLKQLGRVARLTAERAEKASDGSPTTAATPKVETKPAIFQISLYNLANIAPRTTQTITLASADVEGAYRSLLEEANKLGGRVVASEMNHPQPDQASGTMRLDVPVAQAETLVAKMKSLGVILSSVDSQSTDNANVTTTKRGFSLTLVDVSTIPPRETVSAVVRIDSAGNALATLLANVQNSGGRVISQSLNKEANGRDSAAVTVEVPSSASPSLMQSLQGLGKVDTISTSQNTAIPASSVGRSRFDIQLATADAIAPKDGFWNSVRDGLAISFRGLGYSLQLIIVGLCLVAPWALLVWLGVKLRKRMKTRSVVATAQ